MKLGVKQLGSNASIDVPEVDNIPSDLNYILAHPYSYQFKCIIGFMMPKVPPPLYTARSPIPITKGCSQLVSYRQSPGMSA